MRSELQDGLAELGHPRFRGEVRNANIDDQQRHRHGETPVAQGFDPPRVGRSRRHVQPQRSPTASEHFAS